ncbi:MAG: hypothetical protein M1388_03290 [Thaumarchaeota archaeon]|nr:hypothetical protein [Nitrososphaerota archaeon]
MESARLINEKILQRYIFEKLSESSSTRKPLLPARLQPKSSKFRVLIPEYELKSPSHRTDFRLIFKDDSSQNVEVEWTTSRYNHGEAVAKAHYSNNKGYLIVLQNDSSKAASYVRGLDIVEIDPEEFFWWFIINASRLVGATIASHTDNYAPRARRYWIIYVGKEGGAQSDYELKGFPNGTWAFRYAQGVNLRNITSIISGDLVVFTTGWKAPGRQIYPSGNWSCSRVDVLEVSAGYWCDYNDRTFEKASWTGAPEKKEYMHYFQYKRVADSEKLLLKGKLQGSQFDKSNDLDKQICDALRMSNTQRGGPYELTEDAFAHLLQHLHAMTPLLKI